MSTPVFRFRWLSILQFGFVTFGFAANPTPLGKGPGVQPATSPAQAKPSVPAPAPGTIDEKLFNRLQWRQIGPFRGGRALAIEGIPADPDTYYFGAVAGGVWKTSDGGATWTPLFDKEAISSVGAIAVAPSDHNVVYVGTGEAAIRGNATYGIGVFKSVDAGKTWKNIGLKDTHQIGALIIDPRNADVVLVAALGHAFGPNNERGIFRTADGGKTWTKVLSKDENTGGIDVVFDPHNPNIVFAALWQARRQPWFFSSGGPGSGLYRSEDNGVTWKQLTGTGLPDGILGRIGVAVSGADSNRVYAIIEAKEGGLYRSEDAGQTWTRVNDDGRFRQRAWYFSKVYADPKSADTVYLLNTGAFRSVDGGKTFNLLPARHGDHHGLWIDPQDPNRIANVSDGGASISIDGGKTWTTQLNQPTAQFYHVAVDNAFPYHIYGAQQDNSNVGIASRTDSGVIGREDWFEAGDGECGFVVPDPRDWHIIYSNSEGYAVRYDKNKQDAQDISPVPLDNSGHGAVDLAHRFQWVSPLMLSPHDPDTLYTAAECVFKSADHGQSWTQISADLTRNDKSKQQPSGGPLTNDITSVEYYDTIFTLAESPLKKGTLWVGTDDGLVHVTTDDGQHWAKVTPKMPEWSTVDLVEPSPHDANTAYVAVDRHKLDDFKPYIFKTSDLGKTWSAIVNGIPDGAYVHALREDPKKRGLLYAGTELGVFFSFDDGAHWQPLQLNLPQSPIHDLVVKDDDLVVATHGRSFWVLDDVTPLRQVTGQSAGADMVLYQPQTALRLHYPEEIDKKQPAGDNPPPGAIIDYYLKTAPKDEVTLDILDAAGKRVRHLSSKEKKESEQPPEWPDRVERVKTIPANEAMNRFAWDLRYDDPIQIPGAFYSGTGPKGPLALPGDYQVKLTVAGKSQTAPLHLAIDPRTKGAEDALQKQSELAVQVNDRISQLHQAVNEIREVRSQIDSLHKRFGEEERLKSALGAADDLNRKMSEVEQQLIQVNMKGSEANLAFPNMLNERFDSFSHVIESGDNAPTKPQLDVFQMLSGQLEEQLKKWAQIKSDDVPKVSASIKQLDLPALVITPPPK
ncbi:MAG: glycosyl hydrolase [Verrucomicrobia bacterium]|nr:MAG: glycosyl hydrolase [Verrucomicrobiota bacterium]